MIIKRTLPLKKAAKLKTLSMLTRSKAKHIIALNESFEALSLPLYTEQRSILVRAIKAIADECHHVGASDLENDLQIIAYEI